MRKNIPHDHRLLIYKTDDGNSKIINGIHTVTQGPRMVQEGIIIAVGEGAGRDYATSTFKVGEKVLYFNPVEVFVDGKTRHLVDSANILMWITKAEDEDRLDLDSELSSNESKDEGSIIEI